MSCESVLACLLVVIARIAFSVLKSGFRLSGSPTFVLPGLTVHVKWKPCKYSLQRACRWDRVACVSRTVLGLLSVTRTK